MFITCLRAIDVNKKELLCSLKNQNISNELNIEEYLKGIAQQLKQRMSRFIHIRGEENFAVLGSYVIEYQDDSLDSKRRKGTVEYLRDNSIPERRMMIWGEAGLGKTTTLEYLTYIDAKKRLKDTNCNIPILISLGVLTDSKYTIKQYMIDAGISGNISQEDFVKRNSAIYEGIDVDNMKVHITSYDKEQKEICYETSMDTVAGKVTFENKASFILEKGKYKLIWNDSLIFPELDSTDKVKVSTTSAKRGQIIDRNGHLLAGEGVASSIGVVPGKLENKNDAISQLAELLEMKTEDIEKKLAAKWVKDDSFVPLKTVPKVNELKLMSIEPDQETLAEKDRQEKLLEIPGVKISDITVREYPLGEAAAHLVGYVQNVTAEDLEEHAGEGYTSNSVIGKSGMEGLFEKELKGQNGCSITIVDSNGNKKKIIVSTIVENGKDIKLTIDSNLQKELYEQFKDDKSCSVAMNQYTGEVLALVSTPSYDNNDFIRGMSSEKWNALNEDENKPMYNRFRQVWCPGSTFKPIIAAIGLTTGAIDPDEDYGNEGLSWQKDSSWGSYYVTTLHAYEPVILKNALIYSDNIYFAKAALKIGENDMESSLTKLGFNDVLPFDIKMAKSQFSNTEKIEKEVQLADSGYGQGQILVNPLHMACMYSAFCNEGNMIKPYLTYKEDAMPDVWIKEAFTKDAAQIVLEDTKEVINNSHGTGYAAHRTDIILAGKTGTAEIKASKDDTTGTELGWFSVFTTDKNMERPIMIVSMVECTMIDHFNLLSFLDIYKIFPLITSVP